MSEDGRGGFICSLQAFSWPNLYNHGLDVYFAFDLGVQASV